MLCTICGKQIEENRYPTISNKAACSLHCAELSSEIHQLETKLRRVRVQAAETKRKQDLHKKLEKVLELFDTGDDYDYAVPDNYQELKKIDDILTELYGGEYDEF